MSNRYEDIPPPPRYFNFDYQHDFDMARFANAVMYSREEIELASRSPLRLEDPALPGKQREWQFSDQERLAVVDNNERSGLVAMTFVNERDNRIVIAYRGFDNPTRDAGTVLALAADGNALSTAVGMAVGVSPENKAERQFNDAQSFVTSRLSPQWSEQFAESLDYTRRVIEAYPDARIQVTGAGPGGGIAELNAYTFGLGGRTFDPLGARNVIDSQGYKDWLAERGLEPARLRSPQTETDMDGFRSWNTKRDPNAEFGGPQLAPQQRVVGPFAGREGAADYALWAAGVGIDAIEKVPFVGKLGRGVGEVAEALTTAQPLTVLAPLDRERMGWMVRAMKETADERAEQTFGQDVNAPRGQGEKAPAASPYAAARSEPPATEPTAAAVADPKLLETLRGHCQTLGVEHGWTGDHVDRAASALYAQCRQEYVDRIDGVVFGIKGTKVEAGDNLFAYGKQASGFDDRVYVGTVAAMATPGENSLARAQNLDVQRAQEQQLELQMARQNARGGPNLTM